MEPGYACNVYGHPWQILIRNRVGRIIKRRERRGKVWIAPDESVSCRWNDGTTVLHPVRSRGLETLLERWLRVRLEMGGSDWSNWDERTVKKVGG